MKSNLFKLVALIIATATISACSKKETTKSNTELLTQGTWKFSSAGLDADKNGTVDAEDGAILACEKDNIATFNTGGSGSYDEGPSKCDPADPQISSFTWQFKNGEKELEFNGDTFTIFSISDTQLKVYFEGDPGNGTILRYLIIMTH